MWKPEGLEFSQNCWETADFWALLWIPVNAKAEQRSTYVCVKAGICGNRSARRTNGKNRRVGAAKRTETVMKNHQQQVPAVRSSPLNYVSSELFIQLVSTDGACTARFNFHWSGRGLAAKLVRFPTSAEEPSAVLLLLVQRTSLRLQGLKDGGPERRRSSDIHRSFFKRFRGTFPNK